MVRIVVGGGMAFGFVSSFLEGEVCNSGDERAVCRISINGCKLMRLMNDPVILNNFEA